jgi:hypothetical protein
MSFETIFKTTQLQHLSLMSAKKNQMKLKGDKKLFSN